MRVNIFTLGCKANRYESERIGRALAERGFDVYYGLDGSAEFCIINTCAVTAEAERKSRQAVARLSRVNPDIKLVIVGCASAADGARFSGKSGNIIAVLGAAGADTPSETAKILLGANLGGGANAGRGGRGEFARTRRAAYLKIQDGCDNYCSYCIVPFLRGKSRSRPADEIIAEALTLSRSHREIVLTGINVSAYGADTGTNLAALLELLSAVPARIILSSLDVSAVDAELLTAYRELCSREIPGDVGPADCIRFHLSMQSGCDRTLKAMNRRYGAAEFLRKVELIRAYFPDAVLSADVIAGFPGETDEDFSESLRTVRAAGFSSLHVFPYSPRAGTAAAAFPNQIPDGVKARRAAALRETALDCARTR